MAQDPLIGSQLGHFRVEKLIAEGGMGLIYQATHTIIGRKAAIKVLSEKYSSDKNMIKRLHREARAVNRIGHPNIIDIFDFGQTSDHREFFVMEYLQGQSLAQLQDKLRRIPWKLAGPVLAQTLDALAAAHDLGIIHRDIKPENIVIVPQDQQQGVLVKILDFGIAKSIGLGPEGERLTRAGSVMGTPEYIAPEQIRGREVDGRADLYAVGAILFEMVMGRRPFESDKVISLLMMHLREPVPPMEEIPAELGVPRFVPAVVNKAMAKDPDQRFPDARTFARALGLETSAVAPSDGTRPLPELFWEKDGEPPGPGEQLQRGQAPFATQPSARMSSAPSLPGMTGSPAIPTDLLRPAPRRGKSTLRWILPLAIALFSSSAIIFYFAFRGDPNPRQGAGSGTLAGTAAATKKTERPVDLRTLAETVRRVLRSGLSSTEPAVRRLSLQGLGELREPDALALIESSLKTDQQDVRAAAAGALATLGHPRGIAILREARAQADETTRVYLDDALMRLGQTDGTIGLKEALQSADKAVRFQAALALAESNNKAALPALLQLIGPSMADVRAILPVLGNLARLGHADSFASLQKAINTRDPVVCLGAAESLLRIGQGEMAAGKLKQLVASPQPATKLIAAKLLAGTGDFSGLAALRQGIHSSDEKTRQLAADGLGSISDKAVLPSLASALEDPSSLVKATAAEAAARILHLMPTAMVQRGQDWLMTALEHRDWSVRQAAVGATAELDPELAINLLSWAFKDADPRVRLAAIARAEAVKDRRVPTMLASLLGDDSEEVRGRAALALGRRSDPQAKLALQSAVNDRSNAVRAAAAGALLAQGDLSFLKDLREAARSSKAPLRRAALTALGSWADPQADLLLSAALKDKDGSVRFAAAHALAMRGKQAGVAELKKALGKGDQRERLALEALAALGVSRTEELKRLADSSSVESRRAAMDHAVGLPAEAALEMLQAGSQDVDPGVRAGAAGSLATVAAQNPRAMALLRVLARDSDPAVRTRAELALARLGKAKAVLDMGEVKPVKAATLPAPPSAPPRHPDKKSDLPKSLFVDDKSPQQVYMFHSAKAAVALAKGELEQALNHLRAAQRQQDRPALLVDFGQVHLKMALRPSRQPEAARSHLTSARSYFQSYLRRAPGGSLAAKAQGGLSDVKRIWKTKKL